MVEPQVSNLAVAGSSPVSRSKLSSWSLGDFQRIAGEHGCRVIQVAPGDERCLANGTDSYRNHSYIAGRDIELGVYDDEELKVASFFHEIGHIKVPWEFIQSVDYRTPDVEREAWRIGFDLACNYGVTFSQKTHDWSEEQIQGHFSGWEREHAFVEKRRTHNQAVVA